MSVFYVCSVKPDTPDLHLHPKTYFLCLLALLMVGCSTEQNNVTSNIYHNMTAHFNGYYYALEKTREVEKVILKSLDDDPNQILSLFPKLDTTLAKSYSKDTEEIIKMASISIQRHPNSRWVDDNYLLVGKARLYDCDYQNAIQTFKYVNTKSRHADTRHQALIQLMRTFIEQNDFDRAEETFRFLEKEKLNRENKKEFYLGKAYYYQLRNDYDYMVRNLTAADSLLQRKDRKGRIYFIIGQVYQKLGFNSEAYNYYRKCIATNPEYEIDFYARLNMAQVVRLDDKRDIKQLRAQFMKMLTDVKNQEFKDKIYFELGEFEFKQNNLARAIENYQQAAHAGTNKRIQGSAYLQIGRLHFDSLKKYSLAKLYYDSAMTALPKDFENYELIKKRQEVLGEFASYTETIAWNDSLLLLSAFDSLSVRNKLDSIVALRKKQAETARRKKGRNSSNSASNQSSAFFNQQSTATSDWYFGNPSAVALGQSEFQRIWGPRPLEDNWRRSNKSIIISEPQQVTAQNAGGKENTEQAQAKPETITDEVGKVIMQLPRTEKQKAEALAKIEEAYFKLGDLYYFQLNEKGNAQQSYKKLLTRFPHSDYTAEVLYKMYLIAKESSANGAEQYARLLKENHPNSTFTRILLNPDYMRETSVTAEKQKMIYKEAYALFQANNLRAASEKINLALREGETSFTPQLELLKILVAGKTEDVSRYQYELGEYINKYPDGALKPYAEQLLAASKTLLENLERARGIQYAATPEGPHTFIIVYTTAERITPLVSSTLEKFNDTLWKDLKLSTSNLILNDEKTLTLVTEFPNRKEALGYFDKFLAQVAPIPPLANYKFYSFVISKDNFQIFYRTKALDEYLTFFNKNYQKQNP
jgi:tetratricopeptide (TPR) repeat protein